MPGRLLYKKRLKYPHMLGEDILIWERFIDRFPDRFDSVDYDVRVGKGITPLPELPENIKRDAKALTQKRIDVVGWLGELPTIIEVKSRVGLSALGQVLGYKILFESDFPLLFQPELLIVTGKIYSDDLFILNKSLISVVVI